MDEWRRSSKCATSECIEMKRNRETGTVVLRNSIHSAIAVTAEEWAAFVAGVKAGDFDDD